MIVQKKTSSSSGWALLFSGMIFLLLGTRPDAAHALGYADLAVVKPVSSCPDLTKTDLSKVADTPARVTSAEVIDTEKGSFCRILSAIDSQIEVTTYLPVEHWTQRYFEARGLDGPNSGNGLAYSGGCQPALNGEFAVGLSGVRFNMVVGNLLGPQDNFTPDPQKIIDYSYRGNHIAALVSKTLMKAYYGQEPKYSYFIGCSDGGRQALMEAERFPEDFDGVGAGSPGIISTGEESTFHLWKVQADRRADGTNILMPDKVKLLHDSVVAHCDTLSGVKDGLLEDPSACHFKPESMQCASDAANTNCFTADEVKAINNLYDGAHDNKGNYLLYGLARGSESLWNLPKTPTAEEPSAATHAMQLAYILLPETTPSMADYRNVKIDKASFELASTRSPMFDPANTDLKAFAAHGGKLILWHGLSDQLIPARVTMDYYKGVQKFMGTEAAAKFLRAFFPPGVGHCAGGDGYTELDILSPLMAWTEKNQPPTGIIAGKTAPRAGGPGGLGGPGGAGGRQGGPGAGGGGGARPASKLRPFANPTPALVATRPLYPYPYIARYTGKGDPNDAASYTRVTNSTKPWPDHDYEARKLIGPDNQREYQVKDGKVVEVKNAKASAASSH